MSTVPIPAAGRARVIRTALVVVLAVVVAGLDLSAPGRLLLRLAVPPHQLRMQRDPIIGGFPELPVTWYGSPCAEGETR